MKAENLGTS
ncbi:hypothetical protein EYZ11_011989 [Aspergillus tanneri]|uniref:Uncharacterized protein n=1 Tax=Aspergillus tanneri TaxID=1220188 RepID=A0A4V3UMT7_9EURO|nr:hypothetical protein EYZ11_011989 [Aspergillus tanneri]